MRVLERLDELYAIGGGPGANRLGGSPEEDEAHGLEGLGAPLAVVTGIVATARGEVVFEGEPGHAGTTPMSSRRDALADAAEFVLRLRDAAAEVDDGVATVGRLEVVPGASNVIPR